MYSCVNSLLQGCRPLSSNTYTIDEIEKNTITMLLDGQGKQVPPMTVFKRELSVSANGNDRLATPECTLLFDEQQPEHTKRVCCRYQCCPFQVVLRMSRRASWESPGRGAAKVPNSSAGEKSREGGGRWTESHRKLSTIEIEIS